MAGKKQKLWVSLSLKPETMLFLKKHEDETCCYFEGICELSLFALWADFAGMTVSLSDSKDSRDFEERDMMQFHETR